MLSSSLDPRPFDDNYNYYITACKYCVSVTHSHSAGGRNAPEFYYRAMHFSAKRGIAIACRLSVCLSVTLVNCDHIGWNSSKIISSLVSLGCSLFATPT